MSKKKKVDPTQKVVSTISRLKRGDITRIANTLGYSVSQVSRVLSLNSKNKEIVNYAYKLVVPKDLRKWQKKQANKA